jgi:AcrR family transcriptional regulator
MTQLPAPSLQDGPSPAPRSGRAAPLPPDERRASILRAVRPVLLERGAAATTRELAEAAGVAEGTLFRVFSDKLSLIGEAAFVAVDPRDAVPDIEAIERGLPLRERLVAVMEIGFARIGETMRWMGILHELGRTDPRPDEIRKASGRDGWAQWTKRQTDGEVEVRAALERLVGPDAPALRVTPERAVDLFNVLLLGASMRVIDAKRRGVEPEPLAAATLVDLFLVGVVDGPPDHRPQES